MLATSCVKLVHTDKSGEVELELAFRGFVYGPSESITLTIQRCFWKQSKTHFASSIRLKEMGEETGLGTGKKLEQWVMSQGDVQRTCAQRNGWLSANSPYHCGGSKAKYGGVKWRGCGYPYNHTGKSDSLSPPDKSPLDKCGQAAEEPASAVMGCRTAIRMKLYWAKWGSKTRGPQAEKLSQQQCFHSSSYWLNLLKNLHIGIHHTQQI